MIFSLYSTIKSVSQGDMAYQADPLEQPLSRDSGDVLVRESPGEGEGTGENTIQREARDAKEPQTDE